MEPRKPDLPPPTRAERWRVWLRDHDVKRRWERWYPSAIAVVVGGFMMLTDLDERKFAKITADVLPLAVSVAAILAGFQGAMHAIFLTSIRSRAVRFLREKNAYQSLMKYVNSGVISLVIFVALAMTVIALTSLNLWPEWFRVTTALLVASFVFALLASSRIMLLLLALLQHADES